MKSIGKEIATAVLATSLLFGVPAPATAGIPVSCINCSQMAKQILDGITMANELVTAIKQYDELITQTQQQIYMAQSEAMRLMTMPGTVLKKYTGLYTELADMLDMVAMYKGDVSALLDVYRSAYPGFNAVAEVIQSGNPNALQEQWTFRNNRFDALSTDHFVYVQETLKGMSGKNQVEKKRTIEELLDQQNETQIAQAANQINSMMLQDLNELKGLTAMQMAFANEQAQLAKAQEETDRALWLKATEGTDARFEYDGPTIFNRRSK